jgi:hypothetical protein
LVQEQRIQAAVSLIKTMIKTLMKPDVRAMNNIPTLSFLVLGISFLLSTMPAHAGWGKLTVSDGAGNGVEAHSYPFGLGSGMRVQDANGDVYAHKKGIFGLHRSTQASLLGNGVKVNHNFITGTSLKGQDMFGDSFKSKKFLGIGPRITTVNASGMHNVVGNLMHPSPQGPYPTGPNNYAGNGDPNYGGSVMPPVMRPEIPNP